MERAGALRVFLAGPQVVSVDRESALAPAVPRHFPPDLAWIPKEEESPNENGSALPENPGIFAISAPWSLCGSKSYMGVSHEVSLVIIYSALFDQFSFRPGKTGVRRS